MMPLIVEKNVSLKPYNSWKVGGEAEYFARPSSLDELREVVLWAGAESIEVTVLSGGTNVLISDRGIPGLVLHMGRIVGVQSEQVNKKLQVTAWAGSQKAEVLRIFLQHKLSPALFLSGLPGDVGGGVVMNAGVSEDRKPREFCEIVSWVEVMRPTGELVRIEAKDIQWTYRHSDGWQPGVIVRVGLSWPYEPNQETMKKTREATRNRVMKQPLTSPSCGSTFVNPQGHTAGALIDQSGLKGFAVGGAQVSEKHANFIVTDEGAKASDVKAVIDHVKRVVQESAGIELSTEVVFLGDWT